MLFTDRNYDALTAALKPLGFEHQGNGQYSHQLINNKLFDFSACSPEGCMQKLFQVGQSCGKQDLRDQLQQLLQGKD